MTTGDLKTSLRPPLLVGSGRLARHLSFYLKSTFVPYLSWSRKSPIVIADLLQETDTVLLAISDSALDSFYNKNLQSFSGNIVHFSGATSHPKMLGCHPLMSFTTDLLPENFYPQIFFAESSPQTFQRIFPHWKNPTFLLGEQSKALYHACAVLLAAGTQSLWWQTFQQMQTLGVPEKALEIYVKRVTEQFLVQKEKASTGPWVRKDQITIEKNKKALEGSHLLHLYEHLMKGSP